MSESYPYKNNVNDCYECNYNGCYNECCEVSPEPGCCAAACDDPVQGEAFFGRHHFTSHKRDWNLDRGCGERGYITYVKFPKKLNYDPKIFISVTSLDAHTPTGTIRYRVSVEDVSRDGFHVNIYVWSDSQIYGVGINWMAY